MIASNAKMDRKIVFLQMSTHILEASSSGHTDSELQKKKSDGHTLGRGGGGDQGGGGGGKNKDDNSYFEDDEGSKKGGGDGESGKGKDSNHSNNGKDDEHIYDPRDQRTRRPLQVDRY